MSRGIDILKTTGKRRSSEAAKEDGALLVEAFAGIVDGEIHTVLLLY